MNPSQTHEAKGSAQPIATPLVWMTATPTDPKSTTFQYVSIPRTIGLKDSGQKYHSSTPILRLNGKDKLNPR